MALKIGGSALTVLLSMFFLTNTALAAAPTAPTGMATTTLGTTTMVVGWNDNSADETSFAIEWSTTGVDTSYGSTTTIAAIVGTGARTTTISGLTQNTHYWFRIAAIKDFATSTYATIGSGTYTSTRTPNDAAVVTSTASTNLEITLGSTSAATKYLVKDTTGSGKYLQVDGTWSANVANGWQTYAWYGGGSATTTLGLSANTLHTIEVYGQNGDGITTTAASTGVSSYTLAATPNTAAEVTSTAPTTLSIKLGADNNATTYLVKDTVTNKYLQPDHTWSSNVADGWTVYSKLGAGTAVTTTTGVVVNSLHTIVVYGKNGDGVTTSAASAGVSSYTVTDAPNIPALVTSTAPTTLNITLGADNGATKYIVLDTADFGQVKILELTIPGVQTRC